jgi:hypothetical protein
LNAATEKGRTYRYQLIVTAGSYDDPRTYDLLHPKCGCGCQRKLRGEITVVDGKQYIGDHARNVTGAVE